MIPFGQFVMRSRRNAGLLALVFAVLPLLNWLSIIIVALVTLRRGAKEGVLVLGCTLLPSVVWYYFSPNQTILLNIIAGSIVVWLMACVLRASFSWSLTLLIGVMIGIIIIFALHSYVNDMNAWWQAKMLAYIQTAGSEMQMDTSLQQQVIVHLAKIATGLQASVIFAMDLLWLVMARYWQALLYNPGQLRSELHSIRMPAWASVVAIIVAALAWVTKAPMLIDILPLIAVAFALAGISFVHHMVAALKASWLWLVAMYIALVFAQPYITLVLVFMAFGDSVLNYRARLTKRNEQ